MNEAGSRNSVTWIWVAVAAFIGCLGLLVCVCLIGASLIYILPEPSSVRSTTPETIVSNTPSPAASSTSAPTLTATSVSTGPAPLRDSDYVGLWQFPDRWVWIKITAQGQAFQCRIATDRTVFRSEGVLVEGDRIIWQEIWGVDSIRKEANSIILDGKYGEFEYESTDNEMDSACEAPF